MKRWFAVSILLAAGCVFWSASLQAKTITMVCTWRDWKGTFVIDDVAGTVHDPAYNTRVRAQITDQLIVWTDGSNSYRLDRYSGVLNMRNQTNTINYDCQAVQGPKI